MIDLRSIFDWNSIIIDRTIIVLSLGPVNLALGHSNVGHGLAGRELCKWGYFVHVECYSMEMKIVKGITINVVYFLSLVIK